MENEHDFWPWFWKRMGISLIWFAVLEVINALVPNGLLPHWLAAVLGLVAGFLGTYVIVAMWEHRPRSSGHSGGGSFLDDLF